MDDIFDIIDMIGRAIAGAIAGFCFGAIFYLILTFNVSVITPLSDNLFVWIIRVTTLLGAIIFCFFENWFY